MPGSQLPSLVRPCSIADISPHSADVSAARLIQAIAADLVSALRRTVAEAARTLNASHHPHMWDFHACGLAYMQQLNFLDATSEQLREVPRSLFHALMKLQVCHITSHAALHVRLELNRPFSIKCHTRTHAHMLHAAQNCLQQLLRALKLSSLIAESCS